VKLVVGLGNPGRKYTGTRHNVGFEVVERLAARARAGAWQRKSQADHVRARLAGDDVVLAMPQTFMNLSGEAVGPLARFYKVEQQDVIVVHDDVDLPEGRVKVKVGGGAGGHKGLLSIFQHLGKEFVRVRLGVGRPPGDWDTADYVLAKLSSAERRLLDDAVDRAADAVEAVISEGPAPAMNRFNTLADQG
jgi:peptidyl-tRNA hydrolase, PTH1 family